MHREELQPDNLVKEIQSDLALTLTADEKALLDSYRALNTVNRLAVKRYILTGDTRLVRAIYFQVCLGLRPRR